MDQLEDAQVFKGNLDQLVDMIDQKDVMVAIKQVTDTHYSRTYLVLSYSNGKGGQKSMLYEQFTNFTCDHDGRINSMELAHLDLEKISGYLEQKGFKVTHDKGKEFSQFTPNRVHQSTFFH